LLKNMIIGFPWRYVLYTTTILSLAGGLCILLFVPDGPYRKPAQKIKLTAFFSGFRKPEFRASSFGYFGHMWELYAFWTFVPVVLAAHGEPRISLWSFAVIAAGFIGCAAGGLVSLRSGSAPVAFAQLLASGICCVLSPLLFAAPGPAFLAFLLFWGIVVVGDSPQFSALNAAC